MGVKCIRCGRALLIVLVVGSVTTGCNVRSTPATAQLGALPLRAPAVSAGCRSGSVKVTASVGKAPAPLCLYSGARLTVVYDKSKGGIGVPGPWAVPPVTVVPSDVLTVRSTTRSGQHLTVVFKATTTGTATVYATYDNECSKGDTTPCTIPPATTIEFTVTVESP